MKQIKQRKLSVKNMTKIKGGGIRVDIVIDGGNALPDGNSPDQNNPDPDGNQ